MKLVLSLLFLFCCWINVSVAQDTWTLATKKQGIEIYVKHVPGSRLKALKLNCHVHATASQVVALLLDIPATAQWMPHTKTCYVTRQVSPFELYYYTEVDLPWPLTNRDFVSHLQLYRQPNSTSLIVDAPAIAGVLPVKEDVVRVNESKSQWTITPISESQTSVTYELRVDPGGMIPPSLVNYFATDAAVEVIKNMRQMVLLPKYKNASVALYR